MFGYLVLFMVGLMPLNTVIKCLAADSRDGVRNRDTGQFAAAFERTVTDSRSRVLEVHTFLHGWNLLPTFVPYKNNKQLKQ